MPAAPVAQRRLTLNDDADTEALGGEIALFVRPGDTLALSGDLGAGKTTLARALIRALAPDQGAFDVPSPTFTLVQAYDFTRIPVAHFDLYRIADPDEVLELGLDEALVQGIAVIEWPGRMETHLPDDRLDIEIGHAGDGRDAVLSGHGSWAARMERMDEVARFVSASGWSDAERRHFQGDASARRYERLTRASGETVLLMDMPARSDAGIVAHGKTYSALVHLADDIKPVVAMTDGLRALGLAAPEILQCDIEHGFALIEDLGGTVYGELDPERHDVEAAYEVACDVLVHLASSDCPATLPVRGGPAHRIHDFDRDALQFETGLLLDWFWAERRPGDDPQPQRETFRALWDRAFDALDLSAPVWVLRDYHSPNLIWRPDRDGLARAGIIDYQDAVMGHAAYDLASLLQDARIDVPPAREDRHYARYVELRAAADGSFDADAFASAYAILGAQRCTKILGIFARLNRRDGKPGYLRHIPRVSAYLERDLAHPVLGDLKDWFDAHLPHRLRAGDAA